MKLKEVVNRFRDEHLTKKYLKELHDYQILYNLVDEIFPTKSSINSFLSVLDSIQDQNSSELFSLVTLPLHLHDNGWMSTYFENYLRNSHPLIKINSKHIEYFIQHDVTFRTRCNQFEQDVMYSEMTRLLNLINDETSNQYASVPNQIRNSVNAVEDFHQALFGRLTQKIKLDPHSVEIYLEQNSDAWRPQMVNLAFDNQCIKPLNPCQKYVEAEQYTNVIKKVYAQKAIWTELEAYKYYKKHSTIINELGTQTPAMKMKHEVAETMGRAFQHNYNAITNQLFNNINVITDNHRVNE